MENNEIWRPVVGAENYYEVSSTGRVRRIGRRIRKLPIAHGYERLVLSCGGATFTRSVHSLVAEAFIGPRPQGFSIDHIDGNRRNNCVSNLRYCAAKENEANKARLGKRPCGSANPGSKLSDEAVQEICEARAQGGRFWGLTVMAEKHGVSSRAIQKLFKRKVHPVIVRFENNQRLCLGNCGS